MDLALFVFSAALIALLGILVVVRAHRERYAWWFFAMCIALVYWIGANFFTNHFFGSIALVDTANRLSFVFGMLGFYAALMFTYTFPKRRHMRSPEQLIIGVFIVGLSLVASTEFIAGQIRIVDGTISYDEGPGLVLYLIGLVAVLFLSVRNLISTARNGDARQRSRAHLVLAAFFFSATLGILLNVIIPITGYGWEYTRFSPLSTIILTGVISYSIIRHGLFDIRLTAVRTVAYGLTLLTITAMYFGLAYIVSLVLFEIGYTSGISLSPLNILLAVLLAFIFQPIKQFFDQITNRIFFRDRYDTDEFIARLGDVLTSTTDLETLIERAAREIADTFKASHVSFVVHRQDHDDVLDGVDKFPVFEDKQLRAVRGLVTGSDDGVIILDELARRPSAHIARTRALQYLHKSDVALILPLSDEVGYVMIGEQQGSGYSKRDIKVLSTISDELLIAIQNARSVQEVLELNATLHQSIDKATRQLRTSNNKLIKLDETKDEFVSMASHQLRTPLTSVKGYISMVLDGDAGEISPQQKKLLSEAYASSERMVRLISDFLNVSRLQTGKFIIDAKPTDLAKVVAQEVDSIERLAASHDMTLVYKTPKSLPELMLDVDKLRQVIMNFIDNAIYYSRPKSTIVVKLYKDHKWVVFEVHDQGIGVPKDVQKQLFSKFFRAENARRQRPDGTGVGLFLAKRVITAQDGEIIFESTEGKGSVFGFRLPIKHK